MPGGSLMSIRNQDPHSNVPSISEPLRHQHSIYPTRWRVQCTATISSFYPQQCKESRRQEEVSCIHQQDKYIYIYIHTCVCVWWQSAIAQAQQVRGILIYNHMYVYTLCVWLCVCVHMQTYSNLFRLGLCRYELDDGWPESVEEQSLLLLVWRHYITR